MLFRSGADDYVLKPVRGEELLDWLGRTLHLDWQLAAAPAAPVNAVVAADAPSTPAAIPAPAVPLAADIATLPALTSLHALAEQVRVGYPRGIHRWLDHIDATEPGCGDFTTRQRALASRFQLDAMAADIAVALRRREVEHG